MRIFTLWKHEGSHLDMPWLVGSVDEFTIEENGGFPEDYEKQRNEKGVKELIIHISEDAVRKLFTTPEVSGAVKEH
jgi:hypothetical protein